MVKSVHWPRQFVALQPPVNAVETVGKRLGLIGDAVVVMIDQDFDRVAGRVLPRLTKLWPLCNERPTAAIKGDAGGIANERFAGEEADFKAIRQGGEPGFGCIQIGCVCDDT